MTSFIFSARLSRAIFSRIKIVPISIKTDSVVKIKVNGRKCEEGRKKNHGYELGTVNLKHGKMGRSIVLSGFDIIRLGCTSNDGYVLRWYR